MSKTDASPPALIFAPIGRDAELAKALLAEVGIAARICADLPALVEGLTDNVGFAVVTIEAIRGANLKPLAARLADQPAWSDIPILLLTHRGGSLDRNPEAARLSELLGNASLLERPFHPATFVSIARSALKSRLRQFEARSRIEEIREGEANLQTALLAGRLGAWEFDLATEVLQTNASCKALYGRAPDEPFTYDDLVGVIHPEDRARMQSAVASTIATGDDYEIEYRVIAAGRPMKWASISGRIVRDRRGRRIKLIGVSADITERKTAEETLRGANERLEQRVAERTAELEMAHAQRLEEADQRERAEALLHQAQKMEMIGQLTGGVAHDFNNLLMAVLGSLELLKKHIPDEPRARRLIAAAEEGAKRGATLTQRLLAFARRQDLEVKPRDLGELVTGMADLLERSVGAKAQLHYDIDPATPPAAVDDSQVEMALMNLIINARDAMPGGGAIHVRVNAVEIKTSEQLRPGRYVRVQVADEGFGMDEETLAKATDPFFSTKPLGKGTGLGLSMIDGLAKQLGGALRLSSKLGVGTTAELLLPISAERPNAALELVAPFAAPHTRGLRILVVDDDTLIATSTVDMLEDLGHIVVECNSALEALDYLSAEPVLDVVVTDYAMPQMTGLELARAIRTRRPGLAVLLASGFADLPDGETGELPRLAKPYSQAQLREAIEAVLTGQ